MTTQAMPDANEMIRRFQREARATAKLRSEHVVRVSDVGRLESGAPYMVMEYLEGKDLAHLLESVGVPPQASAVEYVVQACEALDEAHRAGIVHRDVKPSNLFLTKRRNGTPCIKVLDFGISKAAQMANASVLDGTKTRSVFGSPMYMAPEQMRSAREVDHRADIWSLGATLYELLTGRVPFAAESLIDLAFRVANEHPPRLRELRPMVPRRLEQAVLRCLEKDRNKRFPDVPALVEAILPFAPRRARLATEADDSEPPSSNKGSGTLVMGLQHPPVPRFAPPPGPASYSSPQLPQPAASQSGPYPPHVVSPGGPYAPQPSGQVMLGGQQPGMTVSHGWGTSQHVATRSSRVPLYVAATLLPLVGLAVAAFLVLRPPRATHPLPAPAVSAMAPNAPNPQPPALVEPGMATTAATATTATTATTTSEPTTSASSPPAPSASTERRLPPWWAQPAATRAAGTAPVAAPVPVAVPPPAARPSATAHAHPANPLDNPN